MYAFEYGESIQEARNFVNSFLGNGMSLRAAVRFPLSVYRVSQGVESLKMLDGCASGFSALSCFKLWWMA